MDGHDSINAVKDKEIRIKMNEAITGSFLKWSYKKWSNELPISWQQVLQGYPSHLRLIKRVDICKALTETLRFIHALGKDPQNITKEDISIASKHVTVKEFLSHLCLYMSATKHWPKSFLRTNAQTRIVKKYLSQGWQVLLTELCIYLEQICPRKVTRYWILRIVTFFIWKSELPESNMFEKDTINDLWEQFWTVPPDGLRAQTYEDCSLKNRALAAFWNFLVFKGRLSAEQKSFQVVDGFWKTLTIEVRTAARHLFSDKTNSIEQDLRKYMALYALTYDPLGFSIHGQPRLLEVKNEDFAKLREQLLQTSFSPEVVAQTLQD
mgnify:FL=1